MGIHSSSLRALLFVAGAFALNACDDGGDSDVGETVDGSHDADAAVEPDATAAEPDAAAAEPDAAAVEPDAAAVELDAAAVEPDAAAVEPDAAAVEPDAAAAAEPVINVGIYRTADQMLLANEINESGEPFAEALGYDLDLLDPMVPGSPDDTAYVLGIENYEYSRYQLGTVVRTSGIGLHMLWAPLVRRAAAAQPDEFDGSMTPVANGVKEDDQLKKTMMMFAQLSNETPPSHAWPQFAEFVSGDPHLPGPVDAANFTWADASTMRWDRSLMDKTLVPSAMGQTLMKQYLWAQDMLSAFHNAADEGIDATGDNSPDLADSPQFDPDNDIFYGGNSRDGFIGQVLTAEAINKVAFLTGALAYDGAALGAVQLASYDPAEGLKYFPHGIAVTEEMVAEGLPPRVSNLEVTDPSSWLFDQASLLWGTGSFTDMMNPADNGDSAHLAYHEVFDGSPFPASMSESGTPGPYDLMKGTSKAIFMNLRAMHWNGDANVYVDRATLGDVGVQRGDRVSTVASAYLIVALESFVRVFDGTPLAARAIAGVHDQATWMVAHLSDGSGAYFDAATVGGDHDDARSLLSQAAAVRGLYVAHRITGEAPLLDAANAAYAALISDFSVPGMGLFRTQLGEDTATYTPRNFAVLAGALREASQQGGVAEAAGLYVAFFLNVGEKMQLSEAGVTGEIGGDSDGDGIPFVPEQPDGLPPVFASEAVFTITQ